MRLSETVQNTLKSPAVFTGVGLHGGEPVRMVVRPAAADHGVWFRRTDVADRDPMIPARWDAVTPSTLCTVIENADGVSVSTIEHIMAALAGFAIHNALIEIDGPEVPILDGSSAEFVAALVAAGQRELSAPLRAIRVLKPVEVTEGEASARLEPGAALVCPVMEMRFGNWLITLATARSSTWARALGRAELLSNIDRPS